ncbi:HDIG domain-containing protein [bacterium]|nr:HDIG domain-containing protein [bacterium]
MKWKVNTYLRRWVRRLREGSRAVLDRLRRPSLHHGLRFVLPVLLSWGALVLTPSREIPDPFIDIAAGRVADRDIIAPFDFQVYKSPEELQSEREKAAAEVLPILEFQPEVKEQVLARMLDFFNALHRVAQEPEIARRLPNWNDYTRQGSAGRHGGYTVSPRVLRALYEVDSLLSLSDDEIVYLLDPDCARILRNSLKDFMVYRLREGLIDRETLGQVDGDFVVLRREGNESLMQKNELSTLRQVMDLARAETVDQRYPEISKNLFISMLSRFMQPNIHYNSDETQNLRYLARQRVKTTRDQTVLRGEKIVGRGERVTEQHLERLENLKRQFALRQSEAGGMGQLRRDTGLYLIYLVLLLPFWIYLLLHRPEVYHRLSPMLIVSITFLIVLGFSCLVLRSEDLPVYMIPVSIAPLLLAYLIDDQVGIAAMVSLSLMVGVQAGFSIYVTLFSLTAGVAAAISVRQVKSRKGQYLSILYIAVASLVAVFAIDFLFRGEGAAEVVATAGWSTVNAFLSTMITIGLLPLMEIIFKVTSNFTLLELSDLNRPLLKRLAIEAPGTYHHSIILGNLAEAAAAGIGANPIFARVAAYYHDIGKLRKPLYFVENQAGRENPHNKLSPKMSSLIISNHVKEGVELARAARLPECIIDVIRQHHGKTHISFFFTKEKERNPETRLNEHDFCYPGPKPLTREAAIIMLADSVESASRTLSEPTVSRIKGLVKKIIDAKLRDGQLDHTGLTLKDLTRIGEEFVPILIGVHHQRIEYPDRGNAEDAKVKATNGRNRNQSKPNGEKAAGKPVPGAEEHAALTDEDASEA